MPEEKVFRFNKAMWNYGSPIYAGLVEEEKLESTGFRGFSVGSITPLFEESDTWAIEAGQFKLFHIGGNRFICVLASEEFNAKDNNEKKAFMDGINRFLESNDVLFIQNAEAGFNPVFQELGKSESFSKLINVVVSLEVEKQLKAYLVSGRT